MCTQHAPTLPIQLNGHRRKRLWDLPTNSHCPVIGVCVPLNALRNVTQKAYGKQDLGSDYDLHVGIVSECVQRNYLTEQLQKYLDKRYARTIQLLKAAKNTESLAEYWKTAITKGDIADFFWASMTHPYCDTTLQDNILRDIHMFQHQAGAENRANMAQYHDVINENNILVKELGKAQERCTRFIKEKNIEIQELRETLTIQINSSREKDQKIEALSQELSRLKTQFNVEEMERLLKKLDVMRFRQVELEAQNKHLKNLLQQPPLSTPSPTPSITTTPHQEPAFTLDLSQKTILCVGGRVSNVSRYRTIIEKAGGNFAHHDGGIENNQSNLDNNLAAADLIICQTGCINHNAYWRIKDFCKRTGKQCIFVKNPSTSSLERSLQKIAVHNLPVTL